MSEYTYLNIVTEHPDAVISNIYFANSLQRTYSIDSSTEKLVYYRIGGDVRETVRDKIEDDFVYTVPIDANVTEGVIGKIVLDRFEDTGDSHQIELYRVKAFDGVEKIGETTCYEDAENTQESVTEYVRTYFDFTPNVTF